MTNNITIEHIRYNQFLLFNRRNSAFGRLVFSCVKATFVSETNYQVIYEAIFQKTHDTQVTCRLFYIKNQDEWCIQLNDNEYRLLNCTNNVASILKPNDIINYYINNETNQFKVLKVFEKYNRITIEEKSTHKHFNLSSILKRYNSEYISSITTYDSIINKI